MQTQILITSFDVNFSQWSSHAQAIHILKIAKLQGGDALTLDHVIEYLESLRECSNCPEFADDICAICACCSMCCECWECPGCHDLQPEDSAKCENCELCESCCTCWCCPGCDEQQSEDELRCQNCETCERCCDCWHCEGCENTWSQDSYRCGNCEYCENCCECESCGNCGRRGEIDYCSDCECCSDCCSCTRTIKPYHANVLSYCSFLGKPKDKTFYGVELEVNVKRSFDVNGTAESIQELLEDFAILKHDSSVSHGFEIVTAPATLEAHREQWSGFFESNPTAQLTGWESGECGMHVHISRPSALTIGKMLVFLNADANRRLINVVAGRSKSSWAKIHPKKITDWDKSYDRYEALNLKNSATVELRIFRSTLKESSFWKNLEFAHAVLNFCRQASVSHLAVADFVKFLQQPENRKTYKHLISFLKEKNLCV